MPFVAALFASVGRLLHIFTPRCEKHLHSRKIFWRLKGVVIIYDGGGGRRENGGVAYKTSCVGWGSKSFSTQGVG